MATTITTQATTKRKRTYPYQRQYAIIELSTERFYSIRTRKHYTNPVFHKTNILSQDKTVDSDDYAIVEKEFLTRINLNWHRYRNWLHSVQSGALPYRDLYEVANNLLLTNFGKYPKTTHLICLGAEENYIDFKLKISEVLGWSDVYQHIEQKIVGISSDEIIVLLTMLNYKIFSVADLIKKRRNADLYMYSIPSFKNWIRDPSEFLKYQQLGGKKDCFVFQCYANLFLEIVNQAFTGIARLNASKEAALILGSQKEYERFYQAIK